MSNKSELISDILQIAPEHADERFLQTKTISELEVILHQAKLAEIEMLREQRIRAQAEAAAARVIFQLNQQAALEPQRKAQAEARLKEDRKTFEDAAKTLRSFGINEANFNTTRQTLGEGFSVYVIQQMLTANRAMLSPPTQEELNQCERERIAARNKFLLEADPGTLRTAAKQEVEQKRVAKQQSQTSTFAGPVRPRLTSEKPHALGDLQQRRGCRSAYGQLQKQPHVTHNVSRRLKHL